MVHKIINEFRPREEMVQPLTATREIKIPLSALPKLTSATDVYNPELDSTQTNEVSQVSVTQPEMIVGNQTASPEANPVNNVIQFPNIDVKALLSANGAQKVEEPVVSISQGVNAQPISTGEPAYGGEPKPVDNVIQFPSSNQDATQNLDELGDALSRMEEALPLINTLFEQVKVAYETSKGKTEEYRKVA